MRAEHPFITEIIARMSSMEKQPALIDQYARLQK